MAAWLNLFLVIGIRALPRSSWRHRAGRGLIHVKDYFAFGRGLTLSIPAAPSRASTSACAP